MRRPARKKGGVMVAGCLPCARRDDAAFGRVTLRSRRVIRPSAQEHYKFGQRLRTWKRRSVMLGTILDKVNLRHGRVREGGGKYRHSFGGPACHDGVVLRGLGRPAHLLYCFDLKDPRLGLSIPNLRWLPIYYAFRNDEGE